MCFQKFVNCFIGLIVDVILIAVTEIGTEAEVMNLQVGTDDVAEVVIKINLRIDTEVQEIIGTTTEKLINMMTNINVIGMTENIEEVDQAGDKIHMEERSLTGQKMTALIIATATKNGKMIAEEHTVAGEATGDKESHQITNPPIIIGKAINFPGGPAHTIENTASRKIIILKIIATEMTSETSSIVLIPNGAATKEVTTMNGAKIKRTTIITINKRSMVMRI